MAEQSKPCNPFNVEPFFLDSPRGPLFCLSLSPRDREPLGGVLYLHPFAEEMHKSRRMAALQARGLASEGYRVLQIDLSGCGDSAGDFGDADWEGWKDDARIGYEWLRNQGGDQITLWGLRTGASLAVQMTRRLPNIRQLILWQPITNGGLFLNQFLRIKLASEMLTSGQAQSSTKLLMSRFEAGESVEVGGYRLSPAMARALAGINLINETPACPTLWLETNASGELSPASQRIIESWRHADANLEAYALAGDAFWATQEITECRSLVKATLDGLAK